MACPAFWEFLKKLKAENVADAEALMVAKMQDAITEAMSQKKQDSDLDIVIFILQLSLGLYVLLDYLLLPWPTGSFMCRWAFFTSVVMYKPFTVPMWYCLTTTCHYAFAHAIFKTYRRDPVLGTPYSAPLPRNKLSLALMAAVACLQMTWALVALPVALPLVATFSPAVLVAVFVVPLVFIVAAELAAGLASRGIEAIAGWFQLRDELKKAKIEEVLYHHYRAELNARARKKFWYRLTVEEVEEKTKEALVEKGYTEEEIARCAAFYKQKEEAKQAKAAEDSKDLHPPPLFVTVAVLKCMATQLVSTAVLTLILLPFFTDGASWGDTARAFLGILSPPSLRLTFALSFGIPHFPFPRLAIAFALGLLLVGVQLAVRLLKALVELAGPALALASPEPRDWERGLLDCFSLLTWRPGRRAQDSVKAAYETSVAVTRNMFRGEMNSEKGCTASVALLSAGILGGCMPLAVMIMQPGNKTFSQDATDQDFDDFTNSENALSYTDVSCKYNENLKNALSLVCGRMPWLTSVTFNLCKELTCDVKVLAQCPGLTSVNFDGCEELTGDLGELRGLKFLQKAIFNECPLITGKEDIRTALPGCHFFLD